MNAMNKPDCLDCADGEGVDRRGFLGAGVSSLLAAGALGGMPALAKAQPAAQPPAQPRPARPAEALIQELHSTLTNDQKRTLVFPWTDARRRGMFNAPFGVKISDSYSAAQQELVQRILRAIASDDEGYSKLTRNGTFDMSQSLGNCGAYIFGDPSNRGQYAWVFAGHHLTVRCDGNSEANTAFGGPMYYGHTPDGYSNRNCFFYQTRSVLSVFDALNENQRRRAVVIGTPGENAASVAFRAANQPRPGIVASDLSADQKRLVETVMRDVLSPYRREDTDEVMQIVRDNGGLDRIHLAFYRDRGATDNSRWHFWRLEGPGFVWNYRVLPHVHTFVNIAKV